MLLTTAALWGVNWPVGKHLLQELPPLSMRGIPGVFGGLLLAAVTVFAGQSLRVPRDQWARLLFYAILSVSGWMGLIGLALVYLGASETAIIGATIPVWAAALAWPVLGEKPNLKRIVAMMMALTGIVVLMGGNGVAATQSKLPGIALALTAAFMFALSAVLAKRKPLRLPPLTSAVWQIEIGCLIVTLAGLMFEKPHLLQLTPLGWGLFAFGMIGQVCIGFACWFGALARLPASIAAIGTLLVPVIGVVASAISLGEPLGPSQIGALALTVAGVAIASRS
ncbi:MAG: DMT family transporter [Xanthobacteraceae bacterium]|nr:DMT family transporter [Xanthobacteraceae bacterium]